MILIKKNEVVLSDILVIDFSDEICLIESDFENKLDYIQKNKISKTSSCPEFFFFLYFFLILFLVSHNSGFKNTLQNYKSILNGKIIIEDKSPKNYRNIKGYMKLKNDPKVEAFNINNIILKESIIIKNAWVLGIVLFEPNESLISKNLEPENSKQNYFTIFLKKFLLVAFCQVIVLSLVYLFFF